MLYSSLLSIIVMKYGPIYRLGMKERDFRDRLREAESLSLKSRPPENKIKWKKARCPNGHLVEFWPREWFNGNLKCSKCRKEFKLTTLDEWFPK